MQTVTDLLEDVDDLVLEVRQAGMDTRRSGFVSYFVNFAERARWEQAVQSASRAGWLTMAYRDGARHVVRLSREGRMSVERFREDWDELREFARDFGGWWSGLSIEQFEPSTYWERLAGLASGTFVNGSPRSDDGRTRSVLKT